MTSEELTMIRRGLASSARLEHRLFYLLMAEARRTQNEYTTKSAEKYRESARAYCIAGRIVKNVFRVYK